MFKNFTPSLLTFQDLLLSPLDKAISIYIHWPFCGKKCPYCDFNSHVHSDIDHGLWRYSYIRELEFFLPLFKNKPIRSIYFGGGTPSLMEPETVKTILDYLEHASGHSLRGVEITLEANPTSVEYTKFQSFKQAGINRISLGIQSLRDESLKFLGREHSSQDAKNAVAALQEFDRYSIDLIYALPGQSLEAWKEELNEALSLARDHISLYQLTIEKGTQFYTMYKKGQILMPSELRAQKLYDLTSEILAQHNIKAYEISNYALDNNYSQHNMGYWNYQPYLGIGPGAHSRLMNKNGECFAMSMKYGPLTWLKDVETQGNGHMTFEKLDKYTTVQEIVLMGLRTHDGIANTDVQAILGQEISNFLEPTSLQALTEGGFLISTPTHLKATPKGLKVLDSVIKAIKIIV